MPNKQKIDFNNFSNPEEIADYLRVNLFGRKNLSEHDVIKYPFRSLANSQNPFDSINDLDRAFKYTDLIISLISFAFECSRPELWKYSDDNNIRKISKDLQHKRDILNSKINRLMPAESQAIAADKFARLSEDFPLLLVYTVEKCWSSLNTIYKNIKKDKKYKYRNKDKDWKRKKAVDVFLNNAIEIIYKFINESFKSFQYKIPKTLKSIKRNITSKIIHNRGDAFSWVALKLIANMTDSSYKRLYALYYERRKEVFNKYGMIAKK